MLFDAQGEDVVSGRRTPETETSIGRLLSGVVEELHGALKRLEREFGDVQDVEFTLEEGRLWILQARSAKRTPRSALRFAVDLVREGIVASAAGLAQLDGLDLREVAVARFLEGGQPISCGIGAAAGVAVGRAVFDSAAAERWTAAGDRVILVRPDPGTADIAGLAVSAGIVTATGGRTAHAVLVGRQLGKACVVGCRDLIIDRHARRAQFCGAIVQEGDWLSVDGETGDVFLGQRTIVTDRPDAELAQVEEWRRTSHRPVATA
jgi:pyruvate,orthophosphate dikinase